MQTEISNYDIINKYKDKINSIKDKLKDLSKPLLDFEKYYSGIIRKNYYTDGELFTGGAGWKDLNEDYYRWKIYAVARGEDLGEGKKAKRTEKLRLTDTLRKEVFSREAVKVSKDNIVYSLNTIYARIHQIGGRTPLGKIPPRPFLYSNLEKGLRKEDRAVYFKILEKYLLKEMEERK